MAQDNIIRIDSQNGMSGSRYNLSYVPNMVNIDPFTEQGTLRLFPRLEEDKDSPVKEPCIIVSTPSGTVYFFSKTTGNIWKRSLGGVWTTLTPNSVITGHRGAGFHFGKIYYFTDTTMGKFDWESELGRNDTFAVGFAGDGQYNHTNALRGMFYFTNGDKIGRIDKQGKVTNNILDIQTGQYAVSLTTIGHKIRIASISGKNGACLHTRSANNNVVFLVNGNRGEIYIDTGSQTWFRRRIPNQETFPAPYNSTIWRGMPLFGWDHRIYTYHKHEEGDNFILCIPFSLPEGTGEQIHSISNIQTNNVVLSFDGWSPSYEEPDELDAGGDNFFVSYEVNNESRIYTLNKDAYPDSGYVEFPIVHGYFGATNKQIKDIRVFTDLIPEGTRVEIASNINNEGFKIVKKYPYLHKTTFKDLITESKDKLRKFFEIRGGFRYKGDHAYVQPKVTLLPDESKRNTPIIRSFIELSS